MRSLALVMLLCLGGSSAFAQKVPTIDQSLEMRSVGAPKISPDGKHVVYEETRTNWDANAFQRTVYPCKRNAGLLGYFICTIRFDGDKFHDALHEIKNKREGRTPVRKLFRHPRIDIPNARNDVGG